jgi:hypothetical protein
MSNKTKTKDPKDIYFKSGYDIYSDKNPEDTVRMKYKTIEDIKETIKKTEKMYKEGKITHKRNIQIYNVMVQRLRVIKKNFGRNEKLNIDNRLALAERHFEKIKKRTNKNASKTSQS